MYKTETLIIINYMCLQRVLWSSVLMQKPNRFTLQLSTGRCAIKY
jgi:hypothetical protein